MDFLLFLHMGNDGLKSPEQLAALLRRVAAKLDEGVVPYSAGTVNLTDMNGNSVGFANFKESDDVS